MAAQALRGAGRQRQPERLGQPLDLAASSGAGRNTRPEPPLRDLGQRLRQLPRAHGGHDEHRLGRQPPQREQQRAQRRLVGPLDVVEHQHRGRRVPEQLEQRARRRRGGARRRRPDRAAARRRRTAGRTPARPRSRAARARRAVCSRKRSTSIVLPIPGSPSTTTTPRRVGERRGQRGQLLQPVRRRPFARVPELSAARFSQTRDCNPTPTSHANAARTVGISLTRSARRPPTVGADDGDPRMLARRAPRADRGAAQGGGRRSRPTRWPRSSGSRG